MIAAKLKIDERRAAYPLNEEDNLNLIFLPLMKSKLGEEEQALKAANLAKHETVPEKDKNYIIATLLVISDKFLSKSNKQKLMEVLKMTEIEQWIREEAREETWKEAREQAREEREKARKEREEERKEIIIELLKKGMPIDDIADVTKTDKKVILAIKEEITVRSGH